MRLFNVLLPFVLVAVTAHADHPIAITHDQREVWVANLPNGSVSVVDTATDTLVREITFGGNPFSLAITPDDRLVFVTNPTLGQVIVIDRASRNIVRRIAMRGAPQDLVITPNGTFCYVGRRFMRAVSVIDVRTFAIVATLPNMMGNFQNQPRGIDVTNDGDTDDLDEFVWVTEFSSSGSQIDLDGNGPRFQLARVTKIAVATHSIAAVVTLQEDPDFYYGGLPTNLRAVHVSPDQSEVWIVGEQGNTARGTRIGGPGGATPDPQGDRAFVRADGRYNGPGLAHGSPPVSQVIRKIDARTNQELFQERVLLSDDRPGSNRTPVGSSRWASWTPDGRYVYIVHAYSMNLTVLDAQTMAEVAVVDCGLHATSLVFGPNDKAYVHALQEFGLTVFDVSNPASPTRTGFVSYVRTPPIPPNVLNGFRLFTAGLNANYFPKSTKVSGTPQMACATCHPEGNSIGLAWDQTELGKAPRLTPDLTEWDQTGHFGFDGARDEMQDFVNAAARFENGAWNNVFDPTAPNAINDPAFGVTANAGRDQDMDDTALALGILFARTPAFLAGMRNSDRSLNVAAQRGFDVFMDNGCQSCHDPLRGFTDSGVADPAFPPGTRIDPGANPNTLKHDVGTIGPLDAPSVAAVINANTGNRSGFDTPHLRHLFTRMAFFHDGRALTVDEVVNTLGSRKGEEHAGPGFLGQVGTSRDATDLKAFLLSIDNTPFLVAEASDPRIGTTWTYELEGQPGLTPLLFLALGPGEITVPGLGTLLLDPNSLEIVVNGFLERKLIDGNGRFDYAVTIPTDPNLIGLRLHFQALSFLGTFNDPRGISNSIARTIRP